MTVQHRPIGRAPNRHPSPRAARTLVWLAADWPPSPTGGELIGFDFRNDRGFRRPEDEGDGPGPSIHAIRNTLAGRRQFVSEPPCTGHNNDKYNSAPKTWRSKPRKTFRSDAPSSPITDSSAGNAL